MAKGKFSKKRDSSHSRKLEETAELPQIPGDEFGPEEDRPFSLSRNQDSQIFSMPELDFHNLTEEDLSSLSREELPEFSTLDIDLSIESEASSPEAPEDVNAEEEPSEPAPEAEAAEPRQEPEVTEESEIEEAFRQASPPEKTSHRKPRDPKKRKAMIIILSSILGILLLALVLTAVLPLWMDPYDRQILDGVSVAGIDLGGMQQSEAVEAVETQSQVIFGQNDMVITLPEGTITLTGADSGITLDAKGAVKAAYRYGRTGTKKQREQDYLDSLTEDHPVDLLPYLSANSNFIHGQIQAYAMEHKTAFTPSSYALEGQQPPLDLEHFNKNNTCQTLLLNLGTPETVLDPQLVTQQLLESWAQLKFAVSVIPQEVGKMPEPLDLQKILEEVSVAPVDSYLDMETFEIISGSYGYTFDKFKASRQVSAAEYGDTVRIPMEYHRPDKLDGDLLFQDVLGEAETPHGNNENRNANLRLACETLNGMILYPGDEFSFNEALGERTAEKGYKAAPAYSGNVLVNSLGGGICQVSSTLYYSCLLADLEITDRINHGYLSSYIAPGMDATVSWGKPDYKFINSSKFPIKIQAEATADQVIIKILGTDDRDYYVEMEYTDSVTPAPVTYESYAPGGEYKDGQVIKGGTDGHYVTTYRCKYSKDTGELISRELETHSSYPPKTSVVASVKESAPAVPESGDSSGDSGSVTPETTPPSTEAPAEPPAEHTDTPTVPAA